jgi:hypothetical protein
MQIKIDGNVGNDKKREEKTMKKNLASLLMILGLILPATKVFPQIKPGAETKKIIVLGSSVAAGWVTSYQKKYDFLNGYAARLGRYLEPRGWQVVNISIPGFDTQKTIARFDKDVLPLKPDFVFIALSLANEGLDTEAPETVMTRFAAGIKTLIAMCKKNGARPVLGLCYSNNSYTAQQYEAIKRMNLLINSWGIPSVNLLGALDDGRGHFPGFTFDEGHPDDRGHEELFYAFVPDLFAALQKGKQIVPPPQKKGAVVLGKPDKFQRIRYIPFEVMHSFSFAFSFKAGAPGALAEIRLADGDHTILLDPADHLLYRTKTAEIASPQALSMNQWHDVILSHGHLAQKTLLYLDHVLVGEVAEQLSPVRFLLGNTPHRTEYRDLFIYRAALNHEEVNALAAGAVLPASLEVFSPLQDVKLSAGMDLKNFALSLHAAQLNAQDDETLCAQLIEKNKVAASLRAQQLKVEPKKAISVNALTYDQYVGQYEIAANDFFVIEKQGNALYFVDRGEKTQIFPEATHLFFIKYPGDLTVRFELDDHGKVAGLVLSINGQEIKAKRVGI